MENEEITGLETEETGFIPDEFDPRDAWFENVFGATNQQEFAPSIDWGKDIKLRQQGSWPFCVLFAIAHNFAFLKGVELSVRYLALRAGTTRKGTMIRSALEVLRKEGAPLEVDFPFDGTTLPRDWPFVMNEGEITKSLQEGAAQNTIGGYAQLNAYNINELKAALQKGPVIIGFGLGRTYPYSEPTVIHNPEEIGAWHCVLLTGYDEHGNFRIGDSLIPQRKLLASNYNIPWAYVITDLPAGWKEKQVQDVGDIFPHAVRDRYGETRDKGREIPVANELAHLIPPYVLEHKGLGGVLGKFWIVYVAAITYGGWSPKDCIEDAIYRLKSGVGLFDFNTIKKD